MLIALYDALAVRQPSPVVALNRAVAPALAYGPQAALPVVEQLHGQGDLTQYHLLGAVHGDLLARQYASMGPATVPFDGKRMSGGRVDHPGPPGGLTRRGYSVRLSRRWRFCVWSM